MEKLNSFQQLGIFEIVIGILSIGFSYYGFYEFMIRGIWWLAILIVLIFFGYGLLGLKAGFDNFKQKGGEKAKNGSKRRID